MGKYYQDEEELYSEIFAEVLFVCLFVSSSGVLGGKLSLCGISVWKNVKMTRFAFVIIRNIIRA